MSAKAALYVLLSKWTDFDGTPNSSHGTHGYPTFKSANLWITNTRMNGMRLLKLLLILHYLISIGRAFMTRKTICVF